MLLIKCIGFPAISNLIRGYFYFLSSFYTAANTKYNLLLSVTWLTYILDSQDLFVDNVCF